MRLIVITPEDQIEHEVALLRAMLSAGSCRIHIRKPKIAEHQMRKYLDSFSIDERRQLVIHSNGELAGEYGLRGVHVAERERTPDHLKRVAEVANIVSTSLHSEQALVEISQENSCGYEYVFLSPLFDSISKPGYRGAFSLSSIPDTLSRSPLPVYALGGVTPDRIQQIRHLGFAGAAVLGAVWQSHDPLQSFYKLHDAWQKGFGEEGAEQVAATGRMYVQYDG